MNLLSHSLAIAPASISNTKSKSLYSILLVLAGIAVLAVSAKIQVPFWPVPMTLQTLAVMGIAAAFGMRMAVSTVAAYLAAGFAGAPVFAGPLAGPAYFAGPTAGFLLGFIVIAAMVGYTADKGWAQKPAKLFASLLVADVICFVLGFVWLGFMFVSAKTGTTIGAAAAYGIVSQYFLSDLVKIAIVSAAVPAIGNLLKR